MSSESSTFASSSKEDDDFTCFIFHIGESFAGGRLPVKVGASFFDLNAHYNTQKVIIITKLMRFLL